MRTETKKEGYRKGLIKERREEGRKEEKDGNTHSRREPPRDRERERRKIRYSETRVQSRLETNRNREIRPRLYSTTKSECRSISSYRSPVDIGESQGDKKETGTIVIPIRC